MDFFFHNTNLQSGKPANTDDTAAAMDAEIRLVARFYSLTLWRIAASTALIAFELICTLNGLRTVSAFYILCVINLLPAFLEPLCAPHISKSTPVLPFLRKRYHYSSVRFATTQLTFFFAGALLVLWQFHNHSRVYPAAWLYRFPALLLGFGILWNAVSPALLYLRIRKKMGAV